MARITIEDCLDKVDNHFELVLIASHRARQLLQGKHTELERGNNKPAVIALREIAEGMINKEVLDESVSEEVHVEQVVAELIKNSAVGPNSLPDPDMGDAHVFDQKDVLSPHETGFEKSAEQQEQITLPAESADEEQQEQTALPAESADEEQESKEDLNVLAEEKNDLSKQDMERLFEESAHLHADKETDLSVAKNIKSDEEESDGES